MLSSLLAILAPGTTWCYTLPVFWRGTWWLRVNRWWNSVTLHTTAPSQHFPQHWFIHSRICFFRSSSLASGHFDIPGKLYSSFGVSLGLCLHFFLPGFEWQLLWRGLFENHFSCRPEVLTFLPIAWLYCLGCGSPWPAGILTGNCLRQFYLLSYVAEQFGLFGTLLPSSGLSWNIFFSAICSVVRTSLSYRHMSLILFILSYPGGH